ncbi:hypothetical protein Hdeb2414_s0008g00280381 [Helianthus debilis subsp. tardiflorus]
MHYFFCFFVFNLQASMSLATTYLHFVHFIQSFISHIFICYLYVPFVPYVFYHTINIIM